MAEHDDYTKGKKIQDIFLDDLLLDPKNPRFGDEKYTNEDQHKILDYIVKKFGVDDVISSIAVNGYFPQEPIICIEEGEKYLVLEGNRRLAACLVLAGDDRAGGHEARTSKYQKLAKENGEKSFNPIPCIVVDKSDYKSVLAYLGIRHIVSTKDWDSYAKASWIDNVVVNHELSLVEISTMIGDSTSTIKTMLEAYRVSNQLTQNNKFDPDNSMRKGRGSINYPFSWVYTLLGYNSARKFLGLGDKSNFNENILEPISSDNIEDASILFKAMFGDKSTGFKAAINDSRQLGALAQVLENPENRIYLEDGKSVDEIILSTTPMDEYLSRTALRVKDMLLELNGRITAEGVSAEVAEKNGRTITHIKRLANDISKKINDEIDE